MYGGKQHSSSVQPERSARDSLKPPDEAESVSNSVYPELAPSCSSSRAAPTWPYHTRLISLRLALEERIAHEVMRAPGREREIYPSYIYKLNRTILNNITSC